MSSPAASNAAIPATPEEARRQLLARVWEKNVPLFRQRLAELGETAAAVREGRLEATKRESAAGIAHTLAGSLGMFGYSRGTELARCIELMLGGDGAVDAAELDNLVTELRATLPL